MALFSCVPIFVDGAKITHLRGSKFITMAFSFIIHTENRFFVGSRFCGSDPPQKPRKLVPNKNKAIHSILINYVKITSNYHLHIIQIFVHDL